MLHYEISVLDAGERWRVLGRCLMRDRAVRWGRRYQDRQPTAVFRIVDQPAGVLMLSNAFDQVRVIDKIDCLDKFD